MRAKEKGVSAAYFRLVCTALTVEVRLTYRVYGSILQLADRVPRVRRAGFRHPDLRGGRVRAMPGGAPKGPSSDVAAKERALLDMARSALTTSSVSERAPEPRRVENPVLPSAPVGGFAAPSSRARPRAPVPGPRRPPQDKSAPPLDYEEPYWSALAESEIGLDVLKNGTIIGNMSVSQKPFVVVGRHPSCDVALQHQSISRQHCVVQHREGNLVYLYDLGSTHGTRVNKRRIPAREHVPVTVGSVVKFGESTRLYIVTGPDALQAAAAPPGPRRLPPTAKARLEQLNKERSEKQRQTELAARMAVSGRVTWGMSDGGTAGQADEEASADPLDGFEPKTERQRKLWGRIEAKERKIENIRGEMATLTRKRSMQGELTEGQERARQRCEQRIAQLEEAVEGMKSNFRDELLGQGRGPGASKKQRVLAKRARKAALSDSDDEFYDRTRSTVGSRGRGKRGDEGIATTDATAAGASRQNAQNKPAPSAANMTLQELKSCIGSLESQVQRLVAYTSQMKRKPQDGGAKSGGGQDSLDSFMDDVSSGLRKEKVRKAELRVRALRARLSTFKTAYAFKKRHADAARQTDTRAQLKGSVSKKRKRTFYASDDPRRFAKKDRRGNGEGGGNGSSSSEEDFRMRRDGEQNSAESKVGAASSAGVASASEAGGADTSAGVGAVMRRVGALRQKLAEKTEARQRSGGAARGTAAKHEAKKLDSSAVENAGLVDSSRKKTPAVPRQGNNEQIRLKYQKLYEKMQRDAEARKTLDVMPASDKAGEQYGLVVRGNAKKRNSTAPRRPSPAPAPVEPALHASDWADTAWAPPKNQTGDGRTHLNDKFGY